MNERGNKVWHGKIMMNMKLKTFGDSLESRWIYNWNLWGRYSKYYAAGDFENKSDSRSLVPGNQNGSGYKYLASI